LAIDGFARDSRPTSAKGEKMKLTQIKVPLTAGFQITPSNRSYLPLNCSSRELVSVYPDWM